jgi:hypothetical protein
MVAPTRIRTRGSHAQIQIKSMSVMTVSQQYMGGFGDELKGDREMN